MVEIPLEMKNFQGEVVFHFRYHERKEEEMSVVAEYHSNMLRLAIL